MNKLTKVFKGIIKSINEKEHTARVVVSTNSVDRDQEVVLPSSFKNRIANYLAHPIMLASHNPWDLENQIGEAKSVDITDDGLEVEFEWYAGKGNSQADWAWFLAQRKIAAFSVGMMIHAYKEGTRNGDGSYTDGIRRTYTDVELFEISQVLIPSNRDAVMSRLGKAQHEEAELVEMAVKSIKEEEWPEGPVTKEIAQQMIREAIEGLTADREKIKNIDVRLTALADSLLGAGPKALLTPTIVDLLKKMISDELKQQPNKGER